jgi:uncharacterized SAM-binding protein YcdF (DUF218 family)
LRRLWKILVILLASLGLLVATVSFTPLVPWWARKLGGPMDDPTGDVLIVLGGSALEDGVIGLGSYWRSVYAIRAYKHSPFGRVIISGGGPLHPAALMKDFLICQGVPQDRVAVEDRSTSTRENALYVKEMMAGQNGRIVLLTSEYHMYRAWRAFRKVGLHVLPRPVPDALKRSASWLDRWPTFLQLCGETVKCTYYWFRGWI